MCGRAGVSSDLLAAYPKGSPTTKKATSTLSASRRISSLSSSTVSRVAVITGRP